MTTIITATDTMRAHLRKREDAHKYVYGHAVVLSGPAGKGGAARLAARAALRIGAGLVTVLCPVAALPETAAQLNAVMLSPIDDGAALHDLLQADERINVALLGPGLGVERARDLVPGTFGTACALVLDADALTAFAPAPDRLFAELHRRPAVLTPHFGEFRRLFPDLATQVQEHALTHIEAARHAADRSGAVVLLKGAETAIAASDGRTALNRATGPDAAPWLATAGAGDVLAGMVAGLLARGFDPFDAAGMGAWLHTAAARSFGPGLIAEDLPEALPAVFRSLGL